jgi:hypothetical protein
VTNQEAIEEAITSAVMQVVRARRMVAELNYDWHDQVENFQEVDAVLESAANQIRTLLLMTRRPNEEGSA